MNNIAYSPEIDEFLLQSGMHPDLIDMNYQTGRFRREMKLGLADASSSLPMLPTYLTTDGKLPAGRPVLVIDMGGTNLRLARVVFHPLGDFEVEALAACPMPGSRAPLTLDEYLAQMIEILRPHLSGDDLKDAIKGRITEKDGSLVGKMESEGTTPRQLTDLIGSLCDLTSGSGDKGTPVVLVQGYFDNYTND